MKKLFPLNNSKWIIALILGIFAAALFAAPRSANKLQADSCLYYYYPNGGNPMCMNSASGGNATAMQTSSVRAQDDFFSPQSMTVAMGTTVTWTNQGMMAHTVTADNGMFDSGTLNPRQTFSFTFSSPGTYGYHCRFHGSPGSGMFGTVVVTSAGQTVNSGGMMAGYGTTYNNSGTTYYDPYTYQLPGLGSNAAAYGSSYSNTGPTYTNSGTTYYDPYTYQLQPLGSSNAGASSNGSANTYYNPYTYQLQPLGSSPTYGNSSGNSYPNYNSTYSNSGSATRGSYYSNGYLCTPVGSPNRY